MHRCTPGCARPAHIAHARNRTSHHDKCPGGVTSCNMHDWNASSVRFLRAPASTRACEAKARSVASILSGAAAVPQMSKFLRVSHARPDVGSREACRLLGMMTSARGNSTKAGPSENPLRVPTLTHNHAHSCAQHRVVLIRRLRLGQIAQVVALLSVLSVPATQRVAQSLAWVGAEAFQRVCDSRVSETLAAARLALGDEDVVWVKHACHGTQRGGRSVLVLQERRDAVFLVGGAQRSDVRLVNDHRVLDVHAQKLLTTLVVLDARESILPPVVFPPRTLI